MKTEITPLQDSISLRKHGFTPIRNISADQPDETMTVWKKDGITAISTNGDAIIGDAADAALAATDAQGVTIIDDGCVRYPVSTAKLSEFGKITVENYEEFCEKVETTLPGFIPGTAEMIDACQRLIDAGAAVYRPE